MRYPSGWRTPAKLVWMLLCMWVGAVMGRTVLHHWILRDFLKLEMFGWRHTDEDDLVPRRQLLRECYCPCTRKSPHSRIFWWQALEEAVGDTYATVNKQLQPRPGDTFGMLRDKRSRSGHIEDGWRSREQYQGVSAEEPNQTAVEVYCPLICHPKKHKWATKGSWMITFLSTVFTLFVGAMIWNVIAVPDRPDDELGNGLGMKNRLFMKLAATGTWLGDFFTAIMVADGLLQELGRHWWALRANQIPDEVVEAVATRHRLCRPGKLRRQLDADDGSLGGGKRERVELQLVMNSITDPARRLKMGHLLSLKPLGLAWDRPFFGLSVSLRVVAVWTIFITATLTVCVGFYADLFKWDEWAEDVNGTNEAERACLAACITMLDLVIVMHDWEFPAFDTAQEVKFPGVEVSDLDCGLCTVTADQRSRDGEEVVTADGRKPRLSCCRVSATGKWFNYGIIFLVMGLDLNMLKNQIIYEPGAFGQYVVPDHPEQCASPALQRLNTVSCQTGRVCFITDRDLADELVSLWADASEALEGAGGEALHPYNFSYHYRQTVRGFNDTCMPSRYENQSLALKMAAALPALCAGAWFFFFLFAYSAFDRRIEKKERTRTGGWFSTPPKAADADAAALGDLVRVLRQKESS
eukprot:TRINITY_DN30201_c0_g1_i1.p1 TRINITY_DN30201_c0_g1~~TRINITY_DN30201_c0_g1_i1.p1  ORF type:complete len:638 (+),score=140.07 TRINITY_DN30201_c0_g1_i1:445-2358(+)